MTTALPSDPSVPPTRLPLRTKLAYGVGEAASSSVTNIRVFFLLFFLTNVAGLDAGLAGTILLIGRIWDAINDPLIGWLSDRTQSRWGKRYPWMLFGILPFAIFFFLQWLVPSFGLDGGSRQGILFWYYVVISLLFDTAYTAVTLSYAALAPEMTQDYNDRTSLISIQMAFSVATGIVSLIVAQVIFSIVEDTNQKYLILAGFCSLLAMGTIALCIWGTRRTVGTESSVVPMRSTQPLRSQIVSVLSNRAFQLVTGAYVFAWVSVQVSAAVLPYYVVNWMGLSEAHVTQMAIAVQATTFGMMFAWSWVGRRWGKKAVFFLGIPVLILSQTGLFFVQPGQLMWMYLYGVGIGLGLSTVYLVPWSMLPDVIDLDELQQGQRREGLFYGFMVQMQKIGLAIALFLVGQGLAWSGFLPSTGDQPVLTQPDVALLAIRLEMGPLPTLALFVSLSLIYFYPITRDIHTEILLKLRTRRHSTESYSNQIVG